MIFMLDRSLPPSFHSLEDIALAPVVRQSLSNGVSLFAIRAGQQPLVNIQLIWQAGRWQEPALGVSSGTARMLSESTLRRPAREVHEAFDFLGAYLSVKAEQDFLVVELLCLRKHLAQALNLLGELVFEPAFLVEDWEKVRSLAIQEWKVNQAKNNIVASARFRELLFGAAHPYGYETTEQVLSGIAVQTLADFHQEMMADRPFDVFLGGDVDEEAVRLAADIFGGHRTKGGVVLGAHAQTLPVTGVHDFARAQAMQTSLRIGRRYEEIPVADRHQADLLNEALGGFFGSRLMKNIREDKGWTYGIHSHISLMQHGAFWMIGTDVRKEVREQAVEEVFKEIALLRKEVMAADEIELVRNYLAGSLVKSLQTPMSHLHYFRSIRYSGLPEDYFEQYVSRIYSLTAEDVRRTAQQYLPEDYWLVVMAG